MSWGENDIGNLSEKQRLERVAERVQQRRTRCPWCFNGIVRAEANGHWFHFDADDLSGLGLRSDGELWCHNNRQKHDCERPSPEEMEKMRASFKPLATPAHWRDTYIGPPDPGTYGG